MEVVLIVIAVLVVAGLMSRGTRPVGGGSTHATQRALAPRPPATPSRDTSDDAFVTGYVIGRHLEGRRDRTESSSHDVDRDAYLDSTDCDDCDDDW